MAFQEIELNMIPQGDMPSFYASQYETGRPIIINVKMGEDDFACTDLFIELHARKVDDNIVTLEPDSVDGNQVVFVGTDQLFACPGKNLAELCLYADDAKDTSLGSLNFFIEVEPDPMAGGLTSETQVYDLYEQVEEITQQVIGDDYYDKTEVDDLLDDKADKSDTYTKSQVDTALNLKADKTTTYTKTQVDNALALKADKTTTYTKTQVDNALALKADKSTTYTKTQVDSALALKANSADLATVATTGDYDDLTNKPTIPAAQVQSDYDQADNTKVDYIKNKPDLSVFVTSDALSEIIYDILPADTASGAIANFDTDLSLPLVDCKANIVATGGNGTPDNPNPINGYNSCTISVADENMSVQDTYTIAFGQTVYGGVLDVTRGELHVTHHEPVALNTLTWIKTTVGSYDCFYADLSGGSKKPFLDMSGLCSSYANSTDSNMSVDNTIRFYGSEIYNFSRCLIRDDSKASLTADQFKATVTGDIIYELATPFDVDLTPVQINALLGVNNVFNDTNGDTEVKYKDGIQHYVDTRI